MARQVVFLVSMIAVTAGGMLLPSPTLAQQTNLPPVEGSKSGVIPPCPTIGEQTAAAGVKSPDGAPAGDTRPVESNVILPSAGGTNSAAPTAQQQGEALRSGIDCPMAPSHPNAIKPGDASGAGLPEFAK